MTHFLDTVPFDYSRPEAQELIGILAEQFYHERKIVQVAQKAGLSPAYLDLDGPAVEVWFSAVGTARNHGKLRELLATVLTLPEAGGIAPRIKEFLADAPPVEAKAPLAVEPSLEPQWGEGFERILGGTNTLIDFAFVREGVRAGSAVCRLTVNYPSNVSAHGTGFLIGPNLILTNHHVLYDWGFEKQPARKVDVWFDYERDPQGGERKVCALAGNPATIGGQSAWDWAVIQTTEPIPDRYAPLPLGAKTPVSVDDRVYIVQHPDGGPKLIGMHDNRVRDVSDRFVQYRTDTKGGSSGSPVCNDRWEVVALHHKYIKTSGPDGRPEYRNQGVNIHRVIAGLEAAGVSFLKA